MKVEIEGRTLLERTVAAALTWADRVIAVAPRPKGWEGDERVVFTRENPPFGGPVAGIDAAFPLLSLPSTWEPNRFSDLTDSLRSDKSFPTGGLAPPVNERADTPSAPALGRPEASAMSAVPPVRAGEILLLAGDLASPVSVVATLVAVPMGRDGVILEDEEGWPQYLAGRYRTAALRDALTEVGDPRDTSVRRLMRPLHLDRVAAPTCVTQDLDTPEDIIRTFDPHR